MIYEFKKRKTLENRKEIDVTVKAECRDDSIAFNLAIQLSGLTNGKDIIWKRKGWKEPRVANYSMDGMNYEHFMNEK